MKVLIEYRENVDFTSFRLPDESALRLLLICGSRWLDINAIESSYGNTPLHLICQGTEDRIIIELLLNSGCHIDCVNKERKSPIKSTPSQLKCLCARIIANQRLNIDILGSSTSVLSKFVLLHGGSLT